MAMVNGANKQAVLSQELGFIKTFKHVSRKELP